MSHWRILPSQQEVARIWPLGLKTAPVTTEGWLKVAIAFPVLASKIRAFLSSPPLTMESSSGLNAREFTSPLWASISLMSFFPFLSQRRMIPFLYPVATTSPFLLIASE